MTSESTQTKDVMTKKVITISKDSTLAEAAEIFSERRVRHLPVTNSEGKIIGILTAKDFSYLTDLRQHKVGTFMTVPVLWVEQDASLRTVILRMIEHKISCLLIGDENSQLMGLITSEDLLWHLASRLEKEEKNHSPLTLFDIQSLEEIANQISLTGL